LAKLTLIDDEDWRVNMENLTAIVILNFNGQKYLDQFLPLVIRYQESAELYVADNGSTDNSLAFLRENYPQIKIIAIPQNKGFSTGYNIALGQIKAKYYVLLNSDIELTEGWLKPMLDWMEKNPKTAACQPKIKAYKRKNFFEHAGAAGGFIDFLGYPFCRGRIFEGIEEDYNQYQTSSEIFWATGACMLIRADLYHQLGGLDDDFFAHMEEIDLCWRLKRRGHQIFYIQESTVYHVGGGTLSYQSPFKVFLNFRNNLALLTKNLPKSRLYQVLLIKLMLDLLAFTFFLIKGHPSSAWAVLKAYFSFYSRFNHWYKKRDNGPYLKKLSGVLQQSVVYQHFIKGKKTFKELEKWF
jgi:GT2 family glycosyltransferase